MVPDIVRRTTIYGKSGEMRYRLLYDSDMHAIVIEQPGGRIQIPLADCQAAGFEDDYHIFLDNVFEALSDRSIASV